MHSQAILASLTAAALGAGCASWFMNGGKLVDRTYAAPVQASYLVPSCQMSNGATMNGPQGLVFQVVQDGPTMAVFEKGPDGSGAVITNHWADPDADHYFSWVKSTGWEYVMPKSPSVPPTRVIYTGLQVSKEGNVTKPISAPTGTCAMLAAR